MIDSKTPNYFCLKYNIQQECILSIKQVIQHIYLFNCLKESEKTIVYCDKGSYKNYVILLWQVLDPYPMNYAVIISWLIILFNYIIFTHKYKVEKHENMLS